MICKGKTKKDTPCKNKTNNDGYCHLHRCRQHDKAGHQHTQNKVQCKSHLHELKPDFNTAEPINEEGQDSQVLRKFLMTQRIERYEKPLPRQSQITYINLPNGKIMKIEKLTNSDSETESDSETDEEELDRDSPSKERLMLGILEDIKKFQNKKKKPLRVPERLYRQAMEGPTILNGRFVMTTLTDYTDMIQSIKEEIAKENKETTPAQLQKWKTKAETRAKLYDELTKTQADLKRTLKQKNIELSTAKKTIKEYKRRLDTLKDYESINKFICDFTHQQRITTRGIVATLQHHTEFNEQVMNINEFINLFKTLKNERVAIAHPEPDEIEDYETVKNLLHKYDKSTEPPPYEENTT